RGAGVSGGGHRLAGRAFGDRGMSRRERDGREAAAWPGAGPASSRRGPPVGALRSPAGVATTARRPAFGAMTPGAECTTHPSCGTYFPLRPLRLDSLSVVSGYA